MRRSPFAATVVSACLAGWAPVAHAATHTFPIFSQLVNNPNDPNDNLDPTAVQLTGAPAGAYNAYSVSVSWSAVAGDPWSNEAIFAFTDTGNLNTVNIFYADPGSAPNSEDNGLPRTLTWSGYLDSMYASPDPLYFMMAQTFDGSSANWNNITTTIMDAVRHTTPFSGNTTGKPTWNRPSSPSTLSSVGTDVPYDVIPFYVDTTSPYFITNTFPTEDGFLAIYADAFSPTDQLNNLVGLIDVGFAGEPDPNTVQLEAGTQYYLVVTGFENTDFGAYAGSISSGDPLAPGMATLGLVPEPASALLILAGLGVFSRRRR